MDDESLRLLTRLAGEHSCDRRARMGNWFVMWVPLVLAVGLGGAVEAHFRGWRAIHATPVVGTVCVLALASGAVWIRTLNGTRYRFEDGSVSCLAPWPRRGWRVCHEDVEAVGLKADHGNWILVLILRDGVRRRIVLTTGMRKRVGLA